MEIKMLESWEDYNDAMTRVSVILSEDILSPKTENELRELVIKIQDYEKYIMEEMDDPNHTEGC